MNVVVMSQYDAEAYAAKKHTKSTIVISITSPGTYQAAIEPNSINGIVDILRLEFYDTDRKNHSYQGITEADGVKIVDFVNKYKNDKLINTIIVHCEAGQSRSSGVAAAILKYMFNDDFQIFGNRKYTPNRLCYRTVLEEFMQREE